MARTAGLRNLMLSAGPAQTADSRGIFDLQVYDIKGKPLNLNRLSGRWVLVVNMHPSDPHWDSQLEWMAAESEPPLSPLSLPPSPFPRPKPRSKFGAD